MKKIMSSEYNKTPNGIQTPVYKITPMGKMHVLTDDEAESTCGGNRVTGDLQTYTYTKQLDQSDQQVCASPMYMNYNCVEVDFN